MTENEPMASKLETNSGAASSGKTFADLIDRILTEPKRWFALLGLFLALSGLTMAVMFVFTHLFHVETSELRLGATDSHVVFAQVRQSTGEGEYLVIVSPEGWQRTGIVVHAGQKVSFSAGGKICIDLNEIWEMVQKRKRYEEEIVQAKAFGQTSLSKPELQRITLRPSKNNL